MSVRTRFAPSPTGSLHVGGVRTALYCLLWARKHGGTFLLRIEDTDQARSTEEAAVGIQRDLLWCGLDWDEGPGADKGHGPYFQSRRLDIYDRHVEHLLETGHAYLAWDSREELDALRKEAEASKQSFRYKRRQVSEEQVNAYLAEGRVPVVRLAAPDHDLTVDDTILGEVTVTADELEDIVIRKADGFPTYHFAVVVDDTLMKVDQILRGKEHLLNTHKHLGIYEALGWDVPNFGHLPLIFNPQGAKMSKREKATTARDAARRAQEQRLKGGGQPDDWRWLAEPTGVDVDDVAAFMRKEHDKIPVAEAIARELGVALPMIEVMDFRKAGYVPEALINYLALLGWSPGDDREIMSFDELVDAFDLSRVKHSEARFDPDKLKWMNGEYIKRLPDSRLLAVTRQYLEVVHTPLHAATDSQLLALFGMYRDRVATLAELEEKARFFFVRPEGWDEKAVKKHLLKGDGVAMLRRVREVLTSVQPWDAATLEAALTPLSPDQLGKIAQPLRVAMTGTAVTPGLFETLAFFEPDELLARIDACLDRWEGASA